MNEKINEEKPPLNENTSSNKNDETPQKMQTKTKFHIVACCAIYFTELVLTLSVFSYLADMIVDFNVVSNKIYVGYYAGLVTCFFWGGKLLTTYFLSVLSDKIGRRPIIIFGSFVILGVSIFFCFTVNFWYFAVLHFLLGIGLGGADSVMKLSFGEITTKKNRSTVFSFYVLMYAFAQIVGGLIGGFLSRPVQQYPFLFSENSIFFFAKNICTWFPFYFCNFVIALLSLIVSIFALFFVLETKDFSGVKKIKIKKDDDVVNDDVKVKSRSWKECVKVQRIPVTSIVLYLCLGMSGGFLYKVTPLWLSLSFESKGLGFTNYEIGITENYSGICGAFTSIFVISWLIKWYCLQIILFLVLTFLISLTPVWTYRLCSMLILIFLPFYPELSYLKGSNSIFLIILMWIILLIHLLVREVCYQSFYSTISVILNNSVFEKNRSRYLGIAQTLMSLIRVFFPVIGSVLFSLGNMINFFPFDAHLFFLVSFFFNLVSCIVAFTLPISLRMTREEWEKHNKKM